MRVYELTVLVKPDLGEKELAKAVKDLQATIEKAGAKIKSKKIPPNAPWPIKWSKAGATMRPIICFSRSNPTPTKLMRLINRLNWPTI